MSEPYMQGMIMEDKKYDIEEVFRLLGTENLLLQDDKHKGLSKDIEVDGFIVRPISLRYMTFYQKGLKCPCCGRQGTYFKLCGSPDTKRRHFNLFAEDGTLMTKDHIIPRSKGGKDTVDNLQTMCTICNSEKGNDCPDMKVEYIVATNYQTGKKSYFRNMEQAVKVVIENHVHPKGKRSELISAAVKATLKIQSALENGSPYCGFDWTYEVK